MPDKSHSPEARSLLQSCLTEYEKKLAAGTLAAAEAEMVDKVKKALAVLESPATSPAARPTTTSP